MTITVTQEFEGTFQSPYITSITYGCPGCKKYSIPGHPDHLSEPEGQRNNRKVATALNIRRTISRTGYPQENRGTAIVLATTEDRETRRRHQEEQILSLSLLPFFSAWLEASGFGHRTLSLFPLFFVHRVDTFGVDQSTFPLLPSSPTRYRQHDSYCLAKGRHEGNTLRLSRYANYTTT